MPLPTDIDSQYEDDPDNPTVSQHQQHHDALHTQYNSYEGTAPADFADAVHGHTEADITDLTHYTDTDANAAIDARVTKTFVDALNIDADTLDGLDSTDFSSSGHGHVEADISDLTHYTDTDANAAIDARVTKTFVDALNVDADTLDGVDSTGFESSGAVEDHRLNDTHALAQPPATHGNEAHSEEYATVSQLSGAVPTGVIAMWSGTIATIPSGWAICDGANGTPDLRDRFIVGAGTTYSPDDTGGAESVTLSTAEMPSHAHGTSAHDHSFSSGTNSDSHSHGGNTSDDNHSHSGTTGSDSHSHSGSTGNVGNHTHAYTHVANTRTVTSGGGSAYYTTGSYNTGGSGAHSHNLSTNSDSHSHNLSTNSDNHSHTVSTDLDSHSHSVSGTTGTASPSTDSIGGGGAHENRPPYYSLAFIMKV